jgi:hypothetical protein
MPLSHYCQSTGCRPILYLIRLTRIYPSQIYMLIQCGWQTRSQSDDVGIWDMSIISDGHLSTLVNLIIVLTVIDSKPCFDYAGDSVCKVGCTSSQGAILQCWGKTSIEKWTLVLIVVSSRGVSPVEISLHLFTEISWQIS